MGALAIAVGTTAASKFHCECMMEDGSTVFLTVKAYSEADATEKIHADYKGVDFVLDFLTPLQLEHRKRHLRRSNLPGAPSLIY